MFLVVVVYLRLQGRLRLRLRTPSGLVRIVVAHLVHSLLRDRSLETNLDRVGDRGVPTSFLSRSKGHGSKEIQGSLSVVRTGAPRHQIFY